jgi:lipopolysaccharide export system permease protein
MKPFVISLLGFAVLILIFYILNDINFLIHYKPGLWLTLKYFLLQLPALLIVIAPIAILFAVLFSLSRLSKNSELIAMRAGGVSIFFVAVPLSCAGFLLFISSVLFNEIVVPKTNKMLDHTKFVEIEGLPEPTANKYRENISMIGAEGEFYNIGAFDGTRDTMTDVLILEFGPHIQLRSRIDAKSAKYESGHWFFYDGYRRTFDETGAEVSADSFDRLPMDIPEKPEDFLKERKELRELDLWELMAYIKQLKRNGSDYHKEMVDLQIKLARPFGCVILALLGIPWGWNMRKFSGIVMSFGICLGVAFFYIGGMQLGQKLGENGVLSPFVSVWMMNILFMVIGPLLLFRKNL